jgi:ribosomal protein S8
MIRYLIIVILTIALSNVKAQSKDTVYIGTMCYSSYPAHYVKRYEVRDSVGKQFRTIEIPDIEANKKAIDEFNKVSSKRYRKYSKDSIITIWSYHK